MFEKISNKVSVAFNKSKIWTKKNSPKILLGVGIVGMVGAVVSAVVATRKLDNVIKPGNEKIDALKSKLNDDNLIANDEIDINATKREINATYAKTALKVCGLYTPTALLLGSSIVAFCGSYKIMNSRNLALATAYTALDKLFMDYRDRVKNKYGQEAEEDIYFDRQYIERKNEEGKIVKEYINNVNPNQVMDLRTWVFDESNPNWMSDMAINVNQLKIAEAECNIILRKGIRHSLLLIDVYEKIGVDLTVLSPEQITLAHMIGWIYDPGNDDFANEVSFGISDKWKDSNDYAKSVIRNGEKSITLTFNFDGDIITKRPGRKNIGEAVLTNED